MHRFLHLFSRMKRHLFTTAGSARRTFPPATLKAIEAAIAEGETLHRAEVCLIVEPALPLQAILHRVTARERASALFTQHRIWDTEENCGVLIYLHHTGRGFQVQPPGLSGETPRLKYHQRGQLDRDADRQRMVQRESGIGVQILLDLGLKNIRVLTNHPKKVVALDGFGLTITEQVGIQLGSKKETHQRF